jgi:transposase
MAYPVDLRQRIVKAMLDRGMTIAEAAKRFEVGTATVERYLRRCRETKDLTPRTSPGRPCGLAQREALLWQQLGQSNDLRLEDRCQQWEEATGERVSTATMSRWFKKLKMTRKKSLAASEQDPPARLVWLAEVQRLDPRRRLFVDESDFRLDMSPQYAYAPRGERAQARVARNRGKNTSLIAAISLAEGVRAAMTVEGAVDGRAFDAYLVEVLCPSLRPGQVVVLDRLSVHRHKKVQAAIEARGCELLFLPAYSPDLKPIEEAFSKIKAWVRRLEARTRKALDEAIAVALRAISLQDVIGWFKHAGYSQHTL